MVTPSRGQLRDKVRQQRLAFVASHRAPGISWPQLALQYRAAHPDDPATGDDLRHTHDRYVLRSIMMRQPVVTIHPRCFATSCFIAMAERIGKAHAAWRKAQARSEEPAPSYFWSLAGRRYG